MVMKMNVGSADRVLRIVAGVVPLVTGLFRVCPAYLPLGINTCPMKER